MNSRFSRFLLALVVLGAAMSFAARGNWPWARLTDVPTAHAIEREYQVRVQGPVDLEKLRRGVQLDDGEAAFERIEAVDPRASGGTNRWYRVTLKEGRNREVRRMFEAVVARVSRLLRIRYGPVELPRDLAPGNWREIANPVKLQKL